ncbi:MAG: SGNH/GDSL hydrolase family protein, partial [Gelidibacter sp.]|nr:SGNH/GDSL hydrolase family protein [Gelidibacter sp.]
MKKLKLCFGILLFSLSLYSCNNDQVEKYKVDGINKKILFVGNSLTYTNNLPELVKQEALSRDIEIEVSMLAYPNYALEDHLNDGEVQNLIEKGNYDFVVVQQGPSSQQDGIESLLEFGSVFKSLCEQNNTQLAFFMVWPSRMYYYTYPGVINNYTQAATANEAILCPVGEVWKAHFDATDDFSYYGPDEFHPSLIGSQVAAQV